MNPPTGRWPWVLGLVAATTTSAVALFSFLDFTPGWQRQPTLTQLAPYRSGMSLREAYETFPAASRGQASLTLRAQNGEAWVDRWNMLAEAERRIDVSYFILKEDVFGCSFLGHLLQKAEEGVRVRILLDAIGTEMAREIEGNDLLDALADHAGITVEIYRPIVNRFLTGLLELSPTALLASEHDKIIVVDEAVSMTGGRNIAAEYFGAPAPDNHVFLDADLRIEDRGVARKLTEIFESELGDERTHLIDAEALDLQDRSGELLAAYRAMQAWLSNEPIEEADRQLLGASRMEELERAMHLRGARASLARKSIRAEVRLLDSRVRLADPDDAITEGIRRLVRSAKRRITVVTPYLVLSERAVGLLRDAARRGVEIALVTNSPVSSDNALSQAFFLEQWPEILAEVPTMRLFVRTDAHNVHAKMASFDGRLALVGTYNLDPLSMAVNSELVVASWSPTLASHIEADIARWLDAGPDSIHEYRIERDEAGEAKRGPDGRPIVAFGPRDHSSPEQWRKVDLYWDLLRAADELPGFDPIF